MPPECHPKPCPKSLCVSPCAAKTKDFCPHLRLVLRDPAHAIRIACRDPLATEDRIGEQWQRLTGGKHSVLATIQNSEALRAKLEACQRRVLQVDQCQGVWGWSAK